MTPAAGVSRGAYLLGSAAVIAAVAYQVARASLPATTLELEGALFAVGSVYAAIVIWQQRRLMSAPPWLSSVQGLGTMLLSASILGVAAPYIPLAMPLSFAVLLTTILASILNADPADRERRVPRPLFAIAPLALGITFVWWRWSTVPRADALTELGVWGGLLLGTGLLLDVHWSIGRARLEARVARVATLSEVAHQLGSATELADVSVAVLKAFADTFPALNWGGILMWNRATQLLESLPVVITPAGVGRVPAGAPAGLGVRSGEGLAGAAFASGTIMHRATSAEARADDGNRGEALNRHISDSVGGIHSAIAVPLRSGKGDVFGVVTLGSTLAEHQWTPQDVVMAQGIGDQAAVALERGLLYEGQKRRAQTDPLTELPNRREFDRLLALPPAGPYAVLAIDLDNLKMINDEYGHEAGDAMLRVVAGAIRAALRAEDQLARVGGDEFAALLPDTDEAAGFEIADRLTRAMQGVAVPFGAARMSIGCAAGTPGDDPRAVWAAADEALYRAKVAGRNQVAVHAVEPPAADGPRRRWAETVPELLARRQMSTVFQPVVDLGTGTILGYEALARPDLDSRDGVEGLFRAAVRLGLGRDLDWLCRRSAVGSAHFTEEDALLFLNVGVPALLDPLHDVDQMLLLLRWSGLRADRVVLEITERENVNDYKRFSGVLDRYREHGFRFAMDDVGEGHSTLEVLATGVPEFIKIARTLTRAAGEPGPCAAIRALHTFAEHRGATLIAEGIETAADVAAMRELGVRFGQGYHLGRPSALEGAPAAVSEAV